MVPASIILRSSLTPRHHMDTREEPLKPHYVYVLIDQQLGGDEAVFYVGKGTGERALAHGQLAARFAGEEHDSPRLHRIQQIRQEGRALLERVVARVDTEAEALRIEAVLIEWMYGKDRLTNRISGHGARYVRTRGDLSERAHLDVPARPTGEQTGEYSANLVTKHETNRTEERLARWRIQLRELGHEVGPVDTSNKTAYKIDVRLPDPCVLHLVARPSQNKVVKLLVAPSSPTAAAEFLSVVSRPGWIDIMKDHRVNNRASRAPYFYLRDFAQAEDNDTDRVSAAARYITQKLASPDVN